MTAFLEILEKPPARRFRRSASEFVGPTISRPLVLARAFFARFFFDNQSRLFCAMGARHPPFGRWLSPASRFLFLGAVRPPLIGAFQTYTLLTRCSQYVVNVTSRHTASSCSRYQPNRKTKRCGYTFFRFRSWRVGWQTGGG